MKKPTIFFVGPLPPPIHGFSSINLKMLNRLQLVSNVVVFDMAPKSIIHSLLNWCRFVISNIRRTSITSYLAISGGRRQWIDLMFVLVSRLSGTKLFVHHHSFSYLNKWRLSAALLVWIFPAAKHIVLCQCMGELLSRRYGVDCANIRMLSNTAFLDCFETQTDFCVHPSKMRLGFLSNITEEKGIFCFFSILQRLNFDEKNFHGLIAGPVDDSIKDAFAYRMANSAYIDYIGPVYGDDKKYFFENIDVLLFPTMYINEAEPLTILECMSFGVPVIAFDRGCISEIIPEVAGVVLHFNRESVREIAEVVERWFLNPEILLELRRSARLNFESLRHSNIIALDSLLLEMSAP